MLIEILVFLRASFTKLTPTQSLEHFFSFMYHRLRSNTCILNLTSSLSDLKSLKIMLTIFKFVTKWLSVAWLNSSISLSLQFLAEFAIVHSLAVNTFKIKSVFEASGYVMSNCDHVRAERLRWKSMQLSLIITFLFCCVFPWEKCYVIS